MGDAAQKRRIVLGLCPKCGGEKDIPSMYTCKTCREKRNERNRSCTNSGICNICKKEEVTPGFVTCENCRTKRKIRMKSWYEEVKSENDIRYQRLSQQRSRVQRNKTKKRKENNLCIHCGKIPPIEGLTICKECQKNNQEDYQFFKEIGVCHRCQKRPAVSGQVECLECKYEAAKRSHRKHQIIMNDSILYKNERDRHKEYFTKVRTERRINHLCIRCGTSLNDDEIENNNTRCINCRLKDSNRDKRKRLWGGEKIHRSIRANMGFCYICGEPSKEGNSSANKPYRLCEECYNKNPIVLLMK